MAVERCERHGSRIAVVMCEHLAEAVERRASAPAFLQYARGDGVALCDACVRRRDVPEPFDAADCGVCEGCLLEWDATTGNEFARRCREAISECPEGFSPVDFEAPPNALRVEGAAFVFADDWRVVTRTGAWLFAEYPHGFWPVLQVRWPRIEGLLRWEGASQFPLADIADSALRASSPYWMQLAFGYIVAGIPVPEGTREVALRVVERFPEHTRTSVRRALGS